MDQIDTHAALMTMVTAIAAGVILIVLSRRINVSAIVLLLAGGVLLGPEGLGLVRPEALGSGLPVLVSIAIGLILFEGGLTLDLRAYRSLEQVIQRLLSVGVLVTWLATTGLVWAVFRFDFSFCLLAASLVIVTGPTVIGPLLKRIKVQPKLHSILLWEGVLIDPIGVFIALLCYEWLGEFGRDAAMARFVLRFVCGLGIGIGGGLIIYQVIKRRWVPEDMVNAFAFGAAMLVFGASEAFFSESGLLSVTVAGLVLGIKKPVALKEIQQFKAEITELLIGTLFMLLSARLDLHQFVAFGWQGVLLVVLVMFLVRPLNVLLSSMGLDLSWREKGFLAWVAPRGIVAASMASLFALNLTAQGMPHAAFIETFTYSVIVSTVLIQGFTAGPLARLLKLRRPQPTGWMIVGAHALGRRLAQFITQVGGQPVVLIDTNGRAVADARAEGFTALRVDARDHDLESHDAIQSIGYLLALTDNEDLNMLLCQQWGEVFGHDHTYCWRSARRAKRVFKGQIAWDGLPKPSVLSGEMERGETVLMHLTDPASDPDHPARPLLASFEGTISPMVDLDDTSEGTQVLFLQREADYLANSLRPELVVRLTKMDRDAVLRDLVTRLSDLVPVLSHGDMMSHLMTREYAFSSALGHGVALPHAYSDGLASRVCAIAQVPDGVDFGALDGEPVRLVFLLVSPANDAEGHLETLAEIARLVSNADIREQLMTAEVPDAVLKIVRDPAL